MIKEILYKWFGLEDKECSTCAVLRNELERAHRDNEILLERLINPPKEKEPENKEPVDWKPIRTGVSRHIPSAVRRQMMDREDNAQLRLLQEINKAREAALEKEVGVVAEEKKEDAAG